MSASVGAPRNDGNVARYPIASSRFVLPSPLPPDDHSEALGRQGDIG